MGALNLTLFIALRHSIRARNDSCRKIGAHLSQVVADALQENTLLGGDSTHRGTLIGLIFGCAWGWQSLPTSLWEHKPDRDALLSIIDKSVEVAETQGYCLPMDMSLRSFTFQVQQRHRTKGFDLDKCLAASAASPKAEVDASAAVACSS